MTDLDKLLELLPPTPRRWVNEMLANRDIKSMPPNSRLDLDSPVPPPRHNKLKKAISAGGPVIVRTLFVVITFIRVFLGLIVYCIYFLDKYSVLLYLIKY